MARLKSEEYDGFQIRFKQTEDGIVSKIYDMGLSIDELIPRPTKHAALRAAKRVIDEEYN